MLTYEDQFEVLTFASRSGTFETVTGWQVTSSLWLAPVYSDTSLVLEAAIPGDANFDGIIDVGDLGLLSAGWGSGAAWGAGDFNGDGTVDVGDLAILSANWGASYPGGAGMSSDTGNIPLPSALSAGVALLGGLGLARRRAA